MDEQGRGMHSAYRCSAANLGANAAVRGCATSTLANQVDEAVQAEVLPLIETAVVSAPRTAGGAGAGVGGTAHAGDTAR